MQIINSFHHQSIYHLNHLHYLQRTYSSNLSSLLPLLLLQFFSITLAAGQNHHVSTAAVSTSAKTTISAEHRTMTTTTVHPTAPNSRASTSSSASSSASNTYSNNNNFHHHPTTLSTDDLTSSATANHRRHRISSGASAIPATDTLLNSIPIFPLDYDNLQPPKMDDGGKPIAFFSCWFFELVLVFAVVVCVCVRLYPHPYLIYLLKSFFFREKSCSLPIFFHYSFVLVLNFFIFYVFFSRQTFRVYRVGSKMQPDLCVCKIVKNRV